MDFDIKGYETSMELMQAVMEAWAAKDWDRLIEMSQPSYRKLFSDAIVRVGLEEKLGPLVIQSYQIRDVRETPFAFLHEVVVEVETSDSTLFLLVNCLHEHMAGKQLWFFNMVSALRHYQEYPV